MKLVRFKGDKDRPSPCPGAVHQGGDIWLVPDNARLVGGATELTGTEARDAVPPRTDLPPDHPMYGRRALRAVPSGSPDVLVNDQGELEFTTIAAEPVVI